MAKIVLSDTAPKGELRFSLGMVEFTPPYETDDADVLANAAVHPWLKVEIDLEAAVEVPNPFPTPVSVPFNANDPKLVRAELERRGLIGPDAAAQAVAIDAELDQKVPVEEAEVAKTFAAVEADKDSDTATSKTKGDK